MCVTRNYWSFFTEIRILWPWKRPYQPCLSSKCANSCSKFFDSFNMDWWTMILTPSYSIQHNMPVHIVLHGVSLYQLYWIFLASHLAFMSLREVCFILSSYFLHILLIFCSHFWKIAAVLQPAHEYLHPLVKSAHRKRRILKTLKLKWKVFVLLIWKFYQVFSRCSQGMQAVQFETGWKPAKT